MAKAGVIVRKLNAIENFGSMDVLCTDKTGTLTLGVVKLDDAIVAQGLPVAHRVAKIAEIPYDFIRKRLTVIIEENAQKLMLTKGALDNILAVCDRIRLGDEILPLDDDHLKDIQTRFAAWSQQGFRVLGVASKLVDSSRTSEKFKTSDEREMIFDGFLLFFDPPKQGVAETIRQLADLGVGLKIITGDNKLVAMHAAQAIGMTLSGVLTGSELNHLHDDALWQVVEHTNLFAEVDPNQKERIITALQKRGHVAGYMGDGINDAPSLHSADVAFPSIRSLMWPKKPPILCCSDTIWTCCARASYWGAQLLPTP